MPKGLITLEEIVQHAKKGSIRVLTTTGKHDYILGRMLGHYVRTGYVVAVFA